MSKEKKEKKSKYFPSMNEYLAMRGVRIEPMVEDVHYNEDYYFTLIEVLADIARQAGIDVDKILNERLEKKLISVPKEEVNE